ncbi:MAG TPA: GDSL-type esterase/lipase family protein [Clostridiales bacterium]|nr:GDSL-type esterase/lipase family protein [Clostridiales bacterium]HPP68887.1 GDSL-type esterase/lipase family protein [Clostridiales bacterium]
MMPKKTVLLIGDSIRIGYCEKVKEELSDIADVYFPQENCRDTHYVLCSLNGWTKLCDPKEVDIVHFNCGHWDCARFNYADSPLTPLSEYEYNIKRIIDAIRYYYPKAKVFFATTTPVVESRIGDRQAYRSNDDIRAYNAAGVRAANEKGVEVNDLFEFALPFDEGKYTDFCHYTDEANVLLGQRVARFIRERL